MKKIFPVARILVAACLLAVTPRAIHAQTGDTLHAGTTTGTTTASENDEEQLRFAQREIDRAQREVMRAKQEIQREIQREVQREAVSAQREIAAEQRAVTYEAVARQSEVVRAKTMAIREQALAQRQAAMAIRQARREEIHQMVDQMLKDHLIEHTDDLHFELRDEHLYINGKEQPKAVYDKYKPYFHQNNQDIQLNLGQGIAI
jgi:flagellar biosynthesis GTPase FlhF